MTHQPCLQGRCPSPTKTERREERGGLGGCSISLTMVTGNDLDCKCLLTRRLQQRHQAPCCDSSAVCERSRRHHARGVGARRYSCRGETYGPEKNRCRHHCASCTQGKPRSVSRRGQKSQRVNRRMKASLPAPAAMAAYVTETQGAAQWVVWPEQAAQSQWPKTCGAMSSIINVKHAKRDNKCQSSDTHRDPWWSFEDPEAELGLI